jgi:GDP-4-dehydro-6-deoxy-D-mannose reductase
MRALVTGGLGFVGRHLVAHLQALGDDVVTLDHHGDEPVDITDAAAVHRAIAAARAQAVYHLAGWADVGASWTDPVGAFRANAEGSLHVFQACVAAGVERVLSVASADVYGIVEPSELPLREDAPMRPTSPYAASKVAADALAHQAFLGHGLGVVRVRPFNHLGPGQSERFVGPALAARVARAERDGDDEIPVGNLTPRRDLTGVRDVVRAYRLLVEAGEPGEVYNVCSGEDVSVQELADRLVGMATRPIALVPDPDLVRPIDLPVLRGDASKLRDATGWRREIPLDRTLSDLLDDMRARATPPRETLERR